MTTTYQIIDRKTQEKIGKAYKRRANALARRDYLDLKWGSYRYGVVAIRGTLQIEAKQERRVDWGE